MTIVRFLAFASALLMLAGCTAASQDSAPQKQEGTPKDTLGGGGGGGGGGY